MKSEYFNNIKLFMKPSTASSSNDDNLCEIEVKYVCEDCNTLMTHDELLYGHWQAPCKHGVVEYHKTRYWCKKCWEKKNSDQKGTPANE